MKQYTSLFFFVFIIFYSCKNNPKIEKLDNSKPSFYTNLNQNDTFIYKNSILFKSSHLLFEESKDIIYSDSFSYVFHTTEIGKNKIQKNMNFRADFGTPLHYTIENNEIFISYMFINFNRVNFIPQNLKFINDTLHLALNPLLCTSKIYQPSLHHFIWVFKIKEKISPNLKCILDSI